MKKPVTPISLRVPQLERNRFGWSRAFRRLLCLQSTKPAEASTPEYLPTARRYSLFREIHVSGLADLTGFGLDQYHTNVHVALVGLCANVCGVCPGGFAGVWLTMTTYHENCVPFVFDPG